MRLSEDASLQYVHSSDTLTLTLNHTAEHLLEADIKLFRKYFWDRAFLVKVCAGYFGVQRCMLLDRVQASLHCFGNKCFLGERFFNPVKPWGHGIGNLEHGMKITIYDGSRKIVCKINFDSFIFLSQPYQWFDCNILIFDIFSALIYNI